MNALAESRSESESTLRVGQILDGKYRVDSPIGQGGMAAVWAGTNERTGKKVALKVLLPSLTNTPGAQALFRREVLAASRVNHPNVVTVFDVIEHRGLTCIVMELLVGEPLGTCLARRGALGINEALGLLLPAMRGVSAAHAQGVIHRDLKPQNIFICVGPDGKAVTTKVLDFGISLVLGGTRDSSASEAPALLMGTPAYMAPEQIAGGAPIDQHADVYGLGALLYEALAGQAPFPGEPGPDLYERILSEGAPPLAQLRPDLSPALVGIVQTAMAREPGLRFDSVDDMVTLLEAELLPATPLPHTSTPSTGTPVLVLPGAAAAERATPTPDLLRHEPSGEHQATLFLVNFPLAAESRTQNASPDDRARYDSYFAHPSPDGSERSEAGISEPPTDITRPIRHRAWQALAGLAIAGMLAGTAFVLWTLAGGDGRAAAGWYPPPLAARPRAGVAALQKPAPRPVDVAPTAPLPVLAASTERVQPDATTAKQPAVTTTVEAPRPAARTVATTVPEGRRTPRAVTRRRPSDAPPLAKAANARGPAEARAGILSAEDF